MSTSIRHFSYCCPFQRAAPTPVPASATVTHDAEESTGAQLPPKDNHTHTRDSSLFPLGRALDRPQQRRMGMRMGIRVASGGSDDKDKDEDLERTRGIDQASAICLDTDEEGDALASGSTSALDSASAGISTSDVTAADVLSTPTVISPSNIPQPMTSTSTPLVPSPALVPASSSLIVPTSFKRMLEDITALDSKKVATPSPAEPSEVSPTKRRLINLP